MFSDAANATSQAQALKIANAGRSSVNGLRYFFTRNPNVMPVKKRMIAGYAVHTYQPKCQISDVPMVLLHGGGFIVGGEHSHGALASELAAATGANVHLVDYPLFPEVQMQTMINACETVITALLKQDKIQQYVLFGDSAGGFLACHVVARAIAAKQSLPVRIYLLSPLMHHCFDFDQVAVKPMLARDDLLGPTYRLVMEAPDIKERALEKLGCRAVSAVVDIDQHCLKQFPPLHITYDRDEVLYPEIQAWIHSLRKYGVMLVDNSVDNGFHAFAVYNYLPMSKAYFSGVSEDFSQFVHTVKPGV